jgi:predicted kinase
LKRFLLQMHGTSASGKTSLANAIGAATGAVVIDKDIIKGGMLENGISEAYAAGTTYNIFLDLGRSFLAQGFSVVLDSPAFFTDVRERGMALAEAACVDYFIVECDISDLDEIQRRMDARTIRASQPTVAAVASYHRPGTAPLTEKRLIVDATLPVEHNLAVALRYMGLEQPAAVGRPWIGERR